jgi:hypothetical protein
MPQYFPGTTILRGSLDASSTPAAFNLRDLRINANDAGNVSPEITAYPSIVEDPGASGSSSSSGSSLGLDLITANNTIANANYGRAAVP